MIIIIIIIITWYVCLFVLDPQPHLSHGVNSQGRTYRNYPNHPGHSSPPCLVSLPVPSPPYFCHASCIRSVPSPVIMSCTYNLSSLWFVPSLFSCPTHIFKPHRKEPLNTHQTPHTNCVNSLFQLNKQLKQHSYSEGTRIITSRY